MYTATAACRDVGGKKEEGRVAVVMLEWRIGVYLLFRL